MEYVYKEITLELQNKDNSVKVFAKRYDNLDRHLKIHITSGGEAVNNIASDEVITFQGTKPDNTHFSDYAYLDTDDDGSQVIIVTLTAQILAVAGVVNCELVFTSGKADANAIAEAKKIGKTLTQAESVGTISTARFSINVDERALPEDIVKSTDEYRSIYSMLLETRLAAQDIRTLNDDILENSANVLKAAQQANAVATSWVDYDASTIPATIDKTQPHVLSSNYAVSRFVDKVSGKALSTNDFSNAYKAQLDNVQDNCTSTSNKYPLSANQGRVLKLAVDAINNRSSIYNSKPSSPKLGDMVITSSEILIYNGSAWKDLGDYIKYNNLVLENYLPVDIFKAYLTSDYTSASNGFSVECLPIGTTAKGFTLNPSWGSFNANTNILTINRSGVYNIYCEARVKSAANGNMNISVGVWNGSRFAAEGWATSATGITVFGSDNVYADKSSNNTFKLAFHTHGEDGLGQYVLDSSQTYLCVYPVRLD